MRLWSCSRHGDGARGSILGPASNRPAPLSSIDESQRLLHLPVNTLNTSSIIHATTVLGVLHNGRVALGSDGQATMKDTVVKHNAQKVRPLYNGKILAGFAGATADAFTLFERFEEKLEQYGGNVTRSAVELAKAWRTDRYLRRLEALLAVAAPERLLLISGTGDVIEPDDNIVAIGSGGPYALAAARAMMACAQDKDARTIVEDSLKIAADICIYTNDHITVLDIESVNEPSLAR